LAGFLPAIGSSISFWPAAAFFGFFVVFEVGSQPTLRRSASIRSTTLLAAGRSFGVVANDFLEVQVKMLRAAASPGYARAASILRKKVTEISEVTYYVALPFVAADDGIAAGEAVECFNPNAAVMRAEALSRKPGCVGAIASISTRGARNRTSSALL
jgi:hypothetical protein